MQPAEAQPRYRDIRQFAELMQHQSIYSAGADSGAVKLVQYEDTELLIYRGARLEISRCARMTASTHRLLAVALVVAGENAGAAGTVPLREFARLTGLELSGNNRSLHSRHKAAIDQDCKALLTASMYLPTRQGGKYPQMTRVFASISRQRAAIAWKFSEAFTRYLRECAAVMPIPESLLAANIQKHPQALALGLFVLFLLNQGPNRVISIAALLAVFTAAGGCTPEQASIHRHYRRRVFTPLISALDAALGRDHYRLCNKGGQPLTEAQRATIHEPATFEKLRIAVHLPNYPKRTRAKPKTDAAVLPFRRGKK